MKEHLRESKKERNKNRPLSIAIREYGQENFQIDLIEECPIEIAPERERYWVDRYNSFKDGYNATYGGLGSNSVDYNKVVDTYLQVRSQKETAELLNISPFTVSSILQQKNVDYDTSYEVLAKRCSKSVDMLSMSGEFIRQFPSIRKATKYIIETENKPYKHIFGIEQHIINVCQGKRNSAYNYKWKYSNVV